MLRAYKILDTAAEAELDDLVELAQQTCRVPIALMSLVDANRQWFKARCGLDAPETPRDVSFCGHAILHDDLFEIEDSHLDPRFADNPLVTGPPHVRFYAGVPLAAANDLPIGTLCVIDHVPRKLEPWQRRVLRSIARQLVAHLELRRRNGELELARQQLQAITEEHRELLGLLDAGVRLPLWGLAKDAGFETDRLVGLRSDAAPLPAVAATSTLVGALVRDHLVDRPLEPTNPRRLLETIRSAFAPLARAQGLSFDLEVEEGIAEDLHVDEPMLHRLLVLVVGATLRRAVGGLLSLHLRNDQGLLRIWVDAPGADVSAEEVAEALESESRVRAKAGHIDDPLQLALCCARRLALELGGDLMPSSGSSHGLCLELLCPCERPPEPQKGRIALVVDAHALRRRVATTLLHRLGWSTVEASNGTEALARLEPSPDLVLVDTSLPRLGGFELAMQIRDAQRTIPIVAMSANLDEEERRRCFAAGIDHLLPRPIRLGALVETVRGLGRR